MRSSPSKQTIEARVVKRFHRLHAPLIELIQSIQDLGDGGEDIDDMCIIKKEDGIQVRYTIKPTQLIIVEGNKRMILRIENRENEQNS